MPADEETQRKLAAQQEAKKRGEPLAFGKSAGPPKNERELYAQHERKMAQELVDVETLFGQQCVALGAQLRAMLATLNQLQRARLRMFGPQDSDLRDLDEADLERQAKAMLGKDGFIERR